MKIATLFKHCSAEIFLLCIFLGIESRADAPCEVPFKVQVYATRALASESGPVEGIITFLIDRPSTGLDVTYAISGTAVNGSDYQAITGTVTIPINETTAILKINPIVDGDVEVDETVEISPLPGPCVVTDSEYEIAKTTIKDQTASNAESPQVSWAIEQGSLGNSCAISRDGGMIAAGTSDGTVFLYVAGTGEVIKSILAHTEAVNQVAFSPDNALLASTSSDKTLKIWKIADGSLVRTFTHSSFLSPVVFGLNSKLVYAGGGNGFIRSWNIETGGTVRTFTGETTPIWGLDLSPDGAYLLSGSGAPNNRVRLWNAVAGSSIRSMSDHTADVRAVRFAPDSFRGASVSLDKTVRVWELSTGRSRPLREATTPLSSVDFTPDGKYVVSGSEAPENKLRFWRLVDYTVIKTFSQHTFSIKSIRFNSSGTGFVYSCDNGFLIYAENPFAPLSITSVSKNESGLNLKWIGANPPFQIQTRPDLETPWSDIGSQLSERSAVIPIRPANEFVRIQGNE